MSGRVVYWPQRGLWSGHFMPTVGSALHARMMRHLGSIWIGIPGGPP